MDNKAIYDAYQAVINRFKEVRGHVKAGHCGWERHLTSTPADCSFCKLTASLTRRHDCSCCPLKADFLCEPYVEGIAGNYWCIGMAFKGISVYHAVTKLNPQELLPWIDAAISKLKEKQEGYKEKSLTLGDLGDGVKFRFVKPLGYITGEAITLGGRNLRANSAARAAMPGMRVVISLNTGDLWGLGRYYEVTLI